jgi:hypothetical protein
LRKLPPVPRSASTELDVYVEFDGNLPAVRAVLAEIDRDPVYAIVIAGDVVDGPLSVSRSSC